MKKILLVLSFMLSVSAYAQNLPDMGNTKVRIVEADKTTLAELNPVTSHPPLKSNLFYFWYSANAIHATQGGFSGKLLNGPYTEFYLNKNLKEQGVYKKGLKDGIWKDWNEDGTLSKAITWRRGVMMNKTAKPFWKKLHFFKRKLKATGADSQAKLTTRR
jgi:hypothetical protein